MKLQFIEENIGNKVYIKPGADLSFSSEFRRIISNKIPLTIIKLTKSGMVYLTDNQNNFYTIPPRNIDSIIYDNYNSNS